MRLMQAASGTRLPKKPLPKLLVLRVVRPEQLQRHHTIHHGVFGLPHVAEPTLAQQPLQPVVPEPRTRSQTTQAIRGRRLLLHYTRPHSAARHCTPMFRATLCGYHLKPRPGLVTTINHEPRRCGDEHSRSRWHHRPSPESIPLSRSSAGMATSSTRTNVAVHRRIGTCIGDQPDRPVPVRTRAACRVLAKRVFSGNHLGIDLGARMSGCRDCK